MQAQVKDNSALVTARFRNHPKFNKAKSDKEKRPIYDDQEIVEIKIAGRKDATGAFPAHEFAEWGQDPDTGERVQITYAQKYNQQYRAFKDGTTQPTSGTPLEALPFLKPAKRLELKALGVHSAEALASIDGQPLKQLGMGGRELKNQAAAYLEEAHPPEGGEMQEIVAAQDARIAALEAELRKAKGEPDTDPQPEANPLDEMNVAQLTAYAAEHEIDLGKATKKADIRKVIDKANDKAKRAPSAFDDYEDADIKNWLAAGGVTVDDRWERADLIEKADALNEQLAADNGKKVG